MAAFSLSHIGMSAIPEELIDICGENADRLSLVNRPEWKLPDVWPGDEAGENGWPAEKIAGRQLYRMGYTLISFIILGSALLRCLGALDADAPNLQSLERGGFGATFSLPLQQYHGRFRFHPCSIYRRCHLCLPMSKVKIKPRRSIYSVTTRGNAELLD